jgi:hypothetical protein
MHGSTQPHVPDNVFSATKVDIALFQRSKTIDSGIAVLSGANWPRNTVHGWLLSERSSDSAHCLDSLLLGSTSNLSAWATSPVPYLLICSSRQLRAKGVLLRPFGTPACWPVQLPGTCSPAAQTNGVLDRDETAENHLRVFSTHQTRSDGGTNPDWILAFSRHVENENIIPSVARSGHLSM